MKNEVLVGGPLSGERLLGAHLKKTAHALLAFLKVKSVSLAIFVLGDRQMTDLKRKFLPARGGPANILAFPPPEGFPHTGRFRPLGEIYLNAAFLKKRAGRDRLLIHGVLHLVGYEHVRKGDIVKMEKLEEKLWQQISSSV
jgi:probable rRNA maturation factor